MKNRLLILLPLLLLIIGCSSFEKQHQKAHGFYTKNKDLLAELCSGTFPSHTEYIKGDEVIVTDTVLSDKIILIDCPDGSQKECPKERIVFRDRLRIDTLKIPDLARERVLITENNKCNSELMLTKAKLADAEKENKGLIRVIIFLGIWLAVSVALLLRKLIR